MREMTRGEANLHELVHLSSRRHGRDTRQYKNDTDAERDRVAGAQRDTSARKRDAHCPHEAIRLTLAEIERTRTTGVLLLRTAPGSIAALRLDEGRATHAVYQGVHGDAALRRAADDGVMATRTDAGVQLAFGSASVLTVTAGEIFSVEPSIETMERWLLGKGWTPAPESTGYDGEPAIPAPLALGSEVGPGLRIEEVLDQGRHGIAYAIALPAHGGARGRFLEWAPPGTTRHPERGVEAEDPREREHYRTLREVWMAGARGRAAMTDRRLGQVWNITQWGMTTGMTADAQIGRPITKVRARWPAQRLRALAIRLTSSIARLHVRGLVHGDLRAETVRIDSDGTIQIGGTALPNHSTPGAWQRPGRYDGLESAVLGEVSESGDLFALATLIIELGTGQQMPSVEQILFEPAADRAVQNALERIDTTAGEALGALVRVGRSPYPPEKTRAIAPLLRSLIAEHETQAQDARRLRAEQDGWTHDVAATRATQARTESVAPEAGDRWAAARGGRAETTAGAKAAPGVRSARSSPAAERTPAPRRSALTPHVREVAETLLADALGATTAARMMSTVRDSTSIDDFVETLAKQIPGAVRRPAHEAREYFAEQVYKAAAESAGTRKD